VGAKVDVDVYVGTPGFEAALISELAARCAGARTLAPGLVAADRPATPDADPVFARQVLREVVEVAGGSISALAEAAYGAVETAVDRWPGPFTVHAFPPPEPPASDTGLPAARLTHTRARAGRRGAAPASGAAKTDASAGLGSRVGLVERALHALLAERRRRASRRHVAEVAAGGFDARVLLVQLLLVDRGRLLVSAAAPRPLPRGGLDLCPWPGGDAPVAEDRAPPSRAYGKLEEAFQWMGAAPRAGETCVDLGAAPGSWTYAAARRGARVVAIDRAPLAPAVARMAGVTTAAGDAFTYAPPAPVDWLLSDVISEPARAIGLVDAWLSAKRCKNLVVTVKFKGRDQYGALAALDPIFARTTPAFARVKHLAHNKNEVTVMATLS
jgi:23S rRNA (cytidine2498-2'-O)-methyltransferase